MNRWQCALAAGPAIIAGAVELCTQPALYAAALIVAVWAACICAITDIRSGYILDAVSIPAAAAALALSGLAGNAVSALAGLASGAGTLLVVYAATRGRGLGLGDVKMAAFIGCALGTAGVLRVLGLAFIAGGIYAGVVITTRRAKPTDAVPFAPYLYGAFLSVLAFPGAPWPV